MLDDALSTIEHSIVTNRRQDGLYHAYNLIGVSDSAVSVDTLYPMLEGQVAALSAGSLAPEDVLVVLDALFESDIYRANQDSFMLYPDRALPGFLAKNILDKKQCESIELLGRMLASGDTRIIERDADGNIRFNAEFANAGDVNARLDILATESGSNIEPSRAAVCALFESVFNHKAFTGRSGTMFGFEGLGSIYWHMVSKLLLAVMENFFSAIENDADSSSIHRLGEYYYRVRHGIGFNKSPSEYGAFPTDPYSHTPENAGARQPGMTGQVKEEVICRFAELGLRVSHGAVRFQPALLREREFIATAREFDYIDVNDHAHKIAVPAQGLAFTWCQVPLVYVLSDDTNGEITVTLKDGTTQTIAGLNLPAKLSQELFSRSDHISAIHVSLSRQHLFSA